MARSNASQLKLMNNTLAFSDARFFPELGWSRWQKWALGAAVWSLPAFAALSYYYLNQVVTAQPLAWRYGLVSTLPWWYTWALLTPAVLSVARRYPIRRENAPRILGTVYAPMMLILLGIHAAVSLLLFRATGIHDTVSMGLYEVHFTSRMHVNAIAFCTILGFYFAYENYHKLQVTERQSVQLELQLAQANLRALKMQLNPHFLFNTLNSLSSLVRQNENTTAVKMLGRLGAFLRLALESKGVPEIPLSQEMDFVERYLEIEKIRFQDRLSIDTQVDPAALHLYVPNFILQPIVENAIHHGIAPHADASKISISVALQGDDVVLKVRDDGPGLKSGSLERRGVGLSNTSERLEQLYGPQQKLSVYNAADKGLVVEITIPAHEQPVMPAATSQVA